MMAEVGENVLLALTDRDHQRIIRERPIGDEAVHAVGGAGAPEVAVTGTRQRLLHDGRSTALVA